MRDRKGQLFDETMRLLRTNPPPVVVLENVPRLLTLDNGAVHRHVSRSLATLGYLVHYRILNSADYGAPQSRKRLFYVAVRPGHAFQWPEPVPSDKRPRQSRPVQMGYLQDNQQGNASTTAGARRRR